MKPKWTELLIFLGVLAFMVGTPYAMIRSFLYAWAKGQGHPAAVEIQGWPVDEADMSHGGVNGEKR